MAAITCPISISDTAWVRDGEEDKRNEIQILKQQ